MENQEITDKKIHWKTNKDNTHTVCQPMKVEITENGTYDVEEAKTADVQVADKPTELVVEGSDASDRFSLTDEVYGKQAFTKFPEYGSLLDVGTTAERLSEGVTYKDVIAYFKALLEKDFSGLPNLQIKADDQIYNFPFLPGLAYGCLGLNCYNSGGVLNTLANFYLPVFDTEVYDIDNWTYSEQSQVKDGVSFYKLDCSNSLSQMAQALSETALVKSLIEKGINTNQAIGLSFIAGGSYIEKLTGLYSEEELKGYFAPKPYNDRIEDRITKESGWVPGCYLGNYGFFMSSDGDVDTTLAEVKEFLEGCVEKGDLVPCICVQGTTTVEGVTENVEQFCNQVANKVTFGFDDEELLKLLNPDKVYLTVPYIKNSYELDLTNELPKLKYGKKATINGEKNVIVLAETMEDLPDGNSLNEMMY